MKNVKPLFACSPELDTYEKRSESLRDTIAQCSYFITIFFFMNFKYANEDLREIMISLRHLIIIINFDNFSCTQPLNVNHRVKKLHIFEQFPTYKGSSWRR